MIIYDNNEKKWSRDEIAWQSKEIPSSIPSIDPPPLDQP